MLPGVYSAETSTLRSAPWPMSQTSDGGNWLQCCVLCRRNPYLVLYLEAGIQRQACSSRLVHHSLLGLVGAREEARWPSQMAPRLSEGQAACRRGAERHRRLLSTAIHLLLIYRCFFSKLLPITLLGEAVGYSRLQAWSGSNTRAKPPYLTPSICVLHQCLSDLKSFA